MAYHYDIGIDSLGRPNPDIVSIFNGVHYNNGIDPDAEYLETNGILVDGGDRFGVAAVAFDPAEELVWVGNQGGHVTSYYGPSLQRYTSFQVFTNEDVRYLNPIDEGLLVLSATQLRCQIRRGLPVFTHTSSNMQEMQCMLQLSSDRILMAGHQQSLIDFDLVQAKERDLISVGESGCALLRRHNRYVCAGAPSGTITLLDPNSLSIEHTLETHTGSLSDFDIQGNLLVTCGFSSGRANQVTCDRFLMVYDLRMLRLVSPIQVIVDPLYLRFFPSVSSRLAVVTPVGQVQLVDTVSLSEPRMCLYQMNNPGAMCLAFDISSTSQSIALGDAAGSLHLFTSNGDATMFNSFSRPSEFGAPIDMGQPVVSFDDANFPIAMIPLPLIGDNAPLASDWPERFIQKVYRQSPDIDSEILRTMKMQGPIGYSTNPKTTHRNQVKYNLMDKSGSHTQQKFSNNDQRNGKSTTDDIAARIPKRYRKVDLKFNRPLQLEDVEQVNKTGLPGLEAILPNAYCNCMIQILYYMEPVRQILLTHTCQKEFCLACELGFLFHMLDLSTNGLPCQPGNFLRAFRTVPEASALGLILNDSLSKAKLDFITLIQNWNRFLVHQVHYELSETKKRLIEEQQKVATTPPNLFVYNEAEFPSISGSYESNNRSQSPGMTNDGVAWPNQNANGTDASTSNETELTKNDEETEISQLFGTKQSHISRCLKCSNEVTKNTNLFVCTLSYPSRSEVIREMSFSDLLVRSLKQEQTTPAWCEICKRFTPTTQLKHLKTLPNVLSINCGLENTSGKLFWQSQIDHVVSKVRAENNEKKSSTSSANLNENGISIKPCRYGDYCARPGCRFKHSNDAQNGGNEGTSKSTGNSAITNNSLYLYYNNPWIPHQMEMKLENGDLKIRKIEDTDKNQVMKPLTLLIGKSTNKTEEEIQETTVNDKDVFKMENLAKKLPGEATQVKKYALTAVVCYINDERRNLVSLVRIPNNLNQSTQRNKTDSYQWYLFNDISVTAVPHQEAVWFHLDWKIPCILYYTLADFQMPRVSVPNPLTQDVFGQDKCLAKNQSLSRGITFTPLAANEMPQPGELIGIDAEFVTLNQEVAELSSDGKLLTVKPSHMSVARITCIRGQGPLEGTPFIDDYISTQEQVVDYLTKFSGIQPGDLDANFSSKHLTTLKSTYQKLRFLQDRGVIFVGHGLQNDFRVINLVVPSEQIIDTVELFHLPRQRMVSLRFLTWHFLSTKIQSITHDSAEDARAALQLYREYKKLRNSGKLNEALINLYDVGKRNQWKVPDD